MAEAYDRAHGRSLRPSPWLKLTTEPMAEAYDRAQGRSLRPSPWPKRALAGKSVWTGGRKNRGGRFRVEPP